MKQYKKLLALDHVELDFTPEALRAIAHEAIERNTGARGLRSILEEVMMDTMFEVPSEPDVNRVLVTAAAVHGDEKPELQLKKAS